MSEAESILKKFYHAKYAERTASGQDPAICVAGHISYAELAGSLSAKYGAILLHVQKPDSPFVWRGWIEFEGIKIYPSKSIEEGFYFGHIEPEP